MLLDNFCLLGAQRIWDCTQCTIVHKYETVHNSSDWVGPPIIASEDDICSYTYVLYIVFKVLPLEVFQYDEAQKDSFFLL